MTNAGSSWLHAIGLAACLGLATAAQAGDRAAPQAVVTGLPGAEIRVAGHRDHYHGLHHRGHRGRYEKGH